MVPPIQPREHSMEQPDQLIAVSTRPSRLFEYSSTLQFIASMRGVWGKIVMFSEFVYSRWAIKNKFCPIRIFLGDAVCVGASLDAETYPTDEADDDPSPPSPSQPDTHRQHPRRKPRAYECNTTIATPTTSPAAPPTNERLSGHCHTHLLCSRFHGNDNHSRG